MIFTYEAHSTDQGGTNNIFFYRLILYCNKTHIKHSHILNFNKHNLF